MQKICCFDSFKCVNNVASLPDYLSSDRCPWEAARTLFRSSISSSPMTGQAVPKWFDVGVVLGELFSWCLVLFTIH
jgi:hypothetical protein